jgi:hypothetical protein
MTRSNAIAFSVLFFAVPTCSGGSGPNPLGRDGLVDPRGDAWAEAPTDTEEDEPPLPPLSRPFQALVPNVAQWSDLEVALVAARVERGMDDT